ncbi:hypothetical protein D0U04_14900 [Bacillus clarus]|uniref:Putative membrane protein n=1 Tax=Bacillus clarus TaxID=2338372 RepID=A0A090ZAC6_9BACI|nr:hypothetical protein [Bacillus clarus]KFN01286.1 putative membrane protein [Bacillus clarus]RFT66271.1 hypothetical protein D0U04_14900 [Bacillus clarus]
MQKVKVILMCLLIITFCMPWYNAFGEKDVNGFTIPTWEEISFFYFLYFTPIFAGISIYQCIQKKDPEIFYLLSGIPNILFWFLLFITDSLYAPLKYSYIGGKAGLLISLLVIITYFVPSTSEDDSVVNERTKKSERV